jgi:hypothetical protein
MDAELHSLLQDVINGSEDAARTLFDKYREPLLYLIRRRLTKQLRARFDSIDIAQDVWASFFSEPLEKRAFRTSEQLIAFLAELARNKVKDTEKRVVHAKKRSAERDFSMDDSHRFDKHALPGPDATPSQIVMSREEWTRFLGAQPPVYRKIFLLMRDGKTNLEISAELGISDRLIRRVMSRLTSQAPTS